MINSHFQLFEQGEIDYSSIKVKKELEAVENNSSDLVSLKDNVEAKRIPGYIVIKINGRFTFANYERIVAKLDKKLKNPVIEEELHVRK